MRKLLSVLLLSMVTSLVMAVPARPGIWRTIKLADGSEVRVTLRGDEHLHFWQSAEGVTYVADGTTGYYKKRWLQSKNVCRVRQMEQRRSCAHLA